MNRRFGKFTLGPSLGRGGHAEVYAAKLVGAEGFSKIVALKLLRPEVSTQIDGLRRFIDEAKICAALNHPNIVQVYEFGMEEGRYFISMEYVPGTTLAKLVAASERHLPIGVALVIIHRILDGLRYAQQKRGTHGEPLRLVHRDLSTHNILLSVDGQVKISDFGVAKSIMSSTKTKTGVAIGKLSAMAPEQARNEPVDERADLFAVGLMAYELLSGRAAYSMSDPEVLNKVSRAEMAPLAEPGVPPAVVAVIERALSANAADRYATANDFMHALDAARPLTLADDQALAALVAPFGDAPIHIDAEIVAAAPESTDMAIAVAPAANGTSVFSRRVVVGLVLGAAATLGAVFLKGERAAQPLPIEAMVPASLPVVVTEKPLETKPPVDKRASAPVPARPRAGFLSVNARPWAEIVIDGKPQGITPLSKLRLPTGDHHLRLHCPSRDTTTELDVTIAPGAELVKLIDFSK